MSSRRSIMTLFSSPDEPNSHRTRIVLAEKGIEIEIIDVVPGRYPEDLLDLNPYHSLPTLVDRDLVLYDSRVIIEYLDERFPHPPLLPVYPVARAKCRLMVHRIEKDWYMLADTIENGKPAEAEKARKQLADNLIGLAPVFGNMPFFLSEEFSLVDCTIAPLLWRLPHFDIELPTQAKAIMAYGKRMFERDSFRASLTEAEREMREKHDS